MTRGAELNGHPARELAIADGLEWLFFDEHAVHEGRPREERLQKPTNDEQEQK